MLLRRPASFLGGEVAKCGGPQLCEALRSGLQDLLHILKPYSGVIVIVGTSSITTTATNNTKIIDAVSLSRTINTAFTRVAFLLLWLS